MTVFVNLLSAALNSFWQMAGITFAVFVALRLVRMNAATRCLIWCLMLFAFAVPLVSRISLRSPLPQAALTHRAPSATDPVGSDSGPLHEAPLALFTVREKRSTGWPMVAFVLWIAGLVWQIARTTRSYVALRGIRRRALPVEIPVPSIGRTVEILASSEIASPMAIGFSPGAVLLPRGLIEQLDAAELKQIVLHEAAHLARRDDWTNLFARLWGAAFALHPLVWFVLRQVEQEREAACDDWVVARTGQPRGYAECLVRVSELVGTSRSGVLAAGVMGGRSRLGSRVGSLLEAGRQFAPRASVRLGLVAGAVLVALGSIGALAPRWIAFAATPEFEVASVRVNQDGQPMQFAFEGSRVTFRNVSMHMILSQVWDIHRDALVGEPSWVQDAHYDMVAKAKAGSSKDELRIMMLHLLEERFHLQWHAETRVMNAYVLTQSKKGIKLLQTDTPPTDADATQCVLTGIVSRKLSCRHITIAEMAQRMPLWSPEYVQTLVLDRTGVEGVYQFELEFNPLSIVNNPDWAKIAPISLPDSLEAHLGLRLESQKAPVPVIVVDHLDRVPAEN